MERVDRLSARVAPVGEKHLVEQLDGRAFDDGAEIAPALPGGFRAHILMREIVAAQEGAPVVEYGDLAVIAQVRRAAPLQRHDGHEPLHLAAGPPDRFDESATAEQ